MSTLSHITVGYLTSHLFIQMGWLPPGSTTYVSGLLFANVPDIDGIISPRHLYNHQHNLKTFSHYPATWMGLLTLVGLLALPFHPPYFISTLAFIAINLLSHFILDSFSLYGGIAWLGPWNKKKFSFLRSIVQMPNNNHDWLRWYIRHWIIYVEVVIWIIGLVVFLAQGTR